MNATMATSSECSLVQASTCINLDSILLSEAKVAETFTVYATARVHHVTGSVIRS